MAICNHEFQIWRDRVLSGSLLDGEDPARFIQAVASAEGEGLRALLEGADAIRRSFKGEAVSLCAIVNARSGRCSEDCAFCAQSAHFDTGAPVHPFLEPDEIEKAARAMRDMGARRFGIVTSGLCLGAQDFERLLEAVRLVSGLGLEADASCGVLGRERLVLLKDAGLKAYHHNLETARSFFPRICTTHDYEEDVAAVREALALGLHVCSGGVFGLGETWEQRAELALTLRELGVPSVPVNFLHPVPGTPMQHRPVLPPEEALKIVAMLRFLLPGATLRICGGRSTVFGRARGLDPLSAGADGLMIGDYLTTRGLDAEADREGILRAGRELAGD